MSPLLTARAPAGDPERAYKTLFEGPHAVFVLDVTTDGRFRVVAFNAAEERLVGLASIDASGRYVDDLLPADAASKVLANYRRCVAASAPISYDEEIEVPAGRRHCATTLVPVRDDAGRVCQLIGVARDITEEKTAIAALRASEERFRQLAENIREVFWMIDAARTEVLYISPAYETIWGRSRDSLRAAPSSWLDAVHPEDRARVEAGLHTQPETTWETTYRIVRPDGSERWIRDRSFPVHEDAGGAVRCVVGLAEDITQLVETEERLRRSEEHLRQAQKLEAIGGLAAGVAHDFNNMLSVVLSYTTILMEDLLPNDPARADLDEVRKAGERGAELTRQLLAFSRKQMLEPTVVDLNRVIEGVAKMLARVVGADISFAVHAGRELGSVYVDAGQLEQALTNLVLNARDAMPRGGQLTIETSNVALAPSDTAVREGMKPGRYVLLAVTDTGIGMDEATKARIFEPFFTTKEKGSGTGLGLATTYGIVRQSGGQICVHSEPGKGTSFRIYLPRTDRAAEPATSLVPHDATIRGTETVLLVEDDEPVRAIMRSILRRHGYTVLEAQNGGEAFLICERFAGPIHLLLTDVVMPRMSGPEVAARLAALRPTMGVLYVSGYAEDSIVHDGVLGAGIALLQKPITPSALLRKVRDVLDGSGREPATGG